MDLLHRLPDPLLKLDGFCYHDCHGPGCSSRAIRATAPLVKGGRAIESLAKASSSLDKHSAAATAAAAAAAKAFAEEPGSSATSSSASFDALRRGEVFPFAQSPRPHFLPFKSGVLNSSPRYIRIFVSVGSIPKELGRFVKPLRVICTFSRRATSRPDVFAELTLAPWYGRSVCVGHARGGCMVFFLSVHAFCFPCVLLAFFWPLVEWRVQMVERMSLVLPLKSPAPIQCCWTEEGWEMGFVCWKPTVL